MVPAMHLKNCNSAAGFISKVISALLYVAFTLAPRRPRPLCGPLFVSQFWPSTIAVTLWSEWPNCRA
eukprot:365916-Chlamydomonas_euryale.AAC.1